MCYSLIFSKKFPCLLFSCGNQERSMTRYRDQITGSTIRYHDHGARSGTISNDFSFFIFLFRRPSSSSYFLSVTHSYTYAHKHTIKLIKVWVHNELNLKLKNGALDGVEDHYFYYFKDGFKVLNCLCFFAHLKDGCRTPNV